MRKIMLILSLAPLAALANPVDVNCGQFPDHPPGHHGHGGFGDQLPPYLEKIDLSSAQKTEIKNLLESRKAEFAAKFGQDKSAIQELHKLSFSNEYSTEKAKALIEKATVSHQEKVLQKAELDNTIYKLLTSEQQQKLQAEIANFKGH
ncbi:Spy/CpxP family protein refolding chaperone [Methylomonas paludis]|uniref:Spy/CpxP family protein refolding chaperone n=1 Tax=Methylomonas paludis TaxID=1173101 RepID=A0A975R8W4_9GAMM|nr:Spy/CpxP family protein refolding chaperone [Methylomonas paludis]QWF70457.1 Spy/CpxP family protein refolding chaperone [Methylomonas paludis]